MWEFIMQWNHSNNKVGLGLVDYGNLLYPQYEHRFKNKISKSMLENLRKEAQALLEDKPYAVDEVVQHWQNIVDGEIPFGFEVEV